MECLEEFAEESDDEEVIRKRPDEGEKEIIETPRKRPCLTRNISPSFRAAQTTRNKYRRIQASPLNATARRLLLAKLNRDQERSMNAGVLSTTTESSGEL